MENEKRKEIIVGAKTLKCYACDKTLIDPDNGVREQIRRWNLNLSDKSYLTATTCQTCVIHPKDFEKLEKKIKDNWDENRKHFPEEVRIPMKEYQDKLKIVGFK